MKPQAKPKPLTLSSDPVERLEAVGTALYSKRGWAGRLAVDLGMARATVYAWKDRTNETPRNLDDLLLTVVERRRDLIDSQYRVQSSRLAATAAALKRRTEAR